MQEALILEPSRDADSCVIWLHGLGADRYDFEPVAKMLQQQLPSTRFVLPQAPTRPVTINGGWSMPSWYDILAMSPARAIDKEQMEASAQAVIGLIEAQRDGGIDPARIILAGFSQGGAVAYLSGLTHPAPLAGIIALSTYIPSADLISGELAEANRQTPSFAAHGTHDDVVSLALGEEALAVLQALGLDPEWRTYGMPHSVCMDEVADIGDWLRRLCSEERGR